MSFPKLYKLLLILPFISFIFIEAGFPQSSKSVSPLLTTGWAQACYYNDSCPDDVNGSCSHALTGCGATAMAQILKYHNYPVNGIGVHSYIDPDYGTLTANFENSYYDWPNMPDILNSSSSPEEVAAVAQLMFHCGVSVEMDYAAGSSFSGTTSLRNAFYDYFRYSSKAQLLNKSHFSDSAWKSMLRKELDEERPVFYCISSGTGGHFIVLDGYSDNDYFHFNWGYGTGYNKKLSELPAVQEAIIGIEPITEVLNISSDFVARFNRFDDGSGTDDYQSSLTTQYLIEPPGADSIALFFSKLNIQSGYDYLTIYDGDTTTAPVIGEYCGDNLPPYLISSSGKMMIEFTTDDSIQSSGFEVGYSAFIPGVVSGLQVITDSTGTFDDGSGTAYYSSHTDAYWLIAPPRASSVTVSFNSFNTEFSCDYLGVYDGDNISPDNLLGVFSSTSLPPDLTANSGKILLHFNSDFSTNRPGWEVSFTSEFDKISLGLKVYLEGAFTENEMSTILNLAFLPLSQPFNRHPWNYYGSEKVSAIPDTNITDWVLIELRDTTEISVASEETIIARRAAFLLNDGRIVDLHSNAPYCIAAQSITNNLFVVIHHRNHLSIISSSPLTEIGGIYSYDFTTDADKVYGAAAGYKQLSQQIWGMAAGDANANGIIDSVDLYSKWKLKAGENGYWPADFNLDSEIDNKDKDDFWFFNLGMEKQEPE